MGSNYLGQIGNGVPTGLSSFLNYPIPMIGLPPKVKKLFSGAYHTCVVIESKEVECWGDNKYGQLGGGISASFSAQPIRVTGLQGPVSKVASSRFHSCALLYDGTVECWGENKFGQLGIGHTNPMNVSQKVVNLLDKAIDIGVGLDHSCAVLKTGQVQCWGNDQIGQLGRGVGHTNATKPVLVLGLNKIKEISLGSDFGCALNQVGQVFCWGSGQYGQLGNSEFVDSFLPTQVQKLPEPMLHISAGSLHVCGVLQSGEVVCWGNNIYGQLGDGTKVDSGIPVFVNGL
jgi:alpha-tubulin suppressor-like RCC1 family protein